MQTIILCGGQGTRLREETEYRPKPLVPVGGRPILWHIMKLYAHHGCRDFILCLGYRGWSIKEYFLNYEAMNNDFTINLGQKQTLDFHGAHEEQNFRVTLAETGINSMTGSRVKQAERYVDGDEVFMTYGDGLSDVDITRLLAFHRAHGRLATVTTVRPISRYGIIDIDPAGRVESFSEKPRLSGWASAGFFVLNRRVFEQLSPDPSSIFEREPLERLATAGQLMAYQHEGFFFAMDTYREYLLLNEMWDRNEAPWKVW